MITVDLFKNEQGLITGYKVSGHAGFAAAGEDIVCGAVSVLTQTPILGLEQHLKCQPSYHVEMCIRDRISKKQDSCIFRSGA